MGLIRYAEKSTVLAPVLSAPGRSASPGAAKSYHDSGVSRWPGSFRPYRAFAYREAPHQMGRLDESTPAPQGGSRITSGYAPCLGCSTSTCRFVSIVVYDEHPLFAYNEAGPGGREYTGYGGGRNVGWIVKVKSADPVPPRFQPTSFRPSISLNRLLIASPSPVPPYRRVVDESTWLKDRKSGSCAPAGCRCRYP